MKIAFLNALGIGKIEEIEVPEGTTLQDLVLERVLPDKIRASINGKIFPLSQTVENGDRVIITLHQLHH